MDHNHHCQFGSSFSIDLFNFCILQVLKRFFKILIVIIINVIKSYFEIIFSLCRRRSTREKRLEEQNKATIGQYANNLAQENNQKKKKGQVMTNLEDFPEQNIPMLNNLDPSNEPTRSDSSSSDRVYYIFINYYKY